NSRAKFSPAGISQALRQFIRNSVTIEWQSPSKGRRQDLAGIHVGQRIERLLDRPHEIDAVAEFAAQEAYLALSDAMLSSAGPLHGDGTHVETGDESLHRLDLAGLFRIDHHLDVEISVANMADDRRDQ